MKGKDGSWARPAGEEDEGEDGTVTVGAGKELRGVPQRRRGDVEPDAGYWGSKNNVNVPVGEGSAGKWLQGGPNGTRKARRSKKKALALGAVLAGGGLFGAYRAWDASRYETVKEGQTLTKMTSGKRNANVKKAADLNRDKVQDPNLIFPGQRLRIR